MRPIHVAYPRTVAVSITCNACPMHKHPNPDAEGTTMLMGINECMVKNTRTASNEPVEFGYD